MSPAARDVSLRDTSTRVDIQWMRALAVSLVILYHFWPWRIRGGFIGVDVFFVISGFLITTHLLGKPPRRFHDLAVFWGRRVRRLLPAAFLVILVTFGAVLLFAPITWWIDNARSVITAAAYVENWSLATQSVDYLASGATPTALQHYWSLSVEEQFYLVWPVLIGGLALLARHRPEPFRLIAGIGLGVLVIASFAWSVYYTAVNPAAAYFVTPTRMWELGAGGVLAAVYPRLHARLTNRPVIQVGVVTVGVAAIIASALLFTGVAFPGWIAAIPVLGAVAVIAAGPADYRVSFDRVLKWRPIQLLGDISYSVYLWHWPVVILVPLAMGREMDWKVRFPAIAATLVLAWASKTFVEDKFRGTHPLGMPLRRTFIFLLVGMVTVTGIGAGVWAGTRALAKPPSVDINSPCVGANMLLDPQCHSQDVHGAELLMTPIEAMYDMSNTFGSARCQWTMHQPSLAPFCAFGSEEPAMHVGLIGNSHANPYFDPLLSIADANNWRLHTYLAATCGPAAALTNLFDTPAANQGCLDFTTKAIADMKQHGTSLVVMAARSQRGDESADYPLLFDQMISAGMRVLVINDVPRADTLIADCVASNPNNLAACDGTRADRLKRDRLYAAAMAFDNPQVSTVDFTDAFCDATTCYGVIGGVIVYFDADHLSRTFAMTLRAPLESAITAALG